MSSPAPRPILFVESPRTPAVPAVTVEESKAISRSKGYEDALRNLLTAAVSVLIAAFAALPQEKLIEFVEQLGIPGAAGLMVLPVLMGIQRYVANRQKHPPNAE